MKYFLFLVLITCLSSCAAPPGDLPRFHVVNEGRVYRSAQPTQKGYVLMAQAGIKTVIKLNTDNLEKERADAKANNIRLIEVPLPGLFGPSVQDEATIQRDLVNPSLWPILFHCEQGQDRTGLVAALYRVHVQGWTPEAAHKEWMDLGHSVLLKGMDLFFWNDVKSVTAF